MVLNVACRDSALMFGGRRTVEELSSRLERYFTDILTVDWDLTMEGSEHVAGCRLHCRGGFYRASAHAMDGRQAMHSAFDKLVKQRRRDKKKLGSARRDTPAHELAVVLGETVSAHSPHGHR
jgi:ribosomal subunit interface protein